MVIPRATAVCARTDAQLEYENGGAAAAARALCERVAAGSGYRTQYQALPFDFVQRCSLEQQESSLGLGLGLGLGSALTPILTLTLTLIQPP